MPQHITYLLIIGASVLPRMSPRVTLHFIPRSFWLQQHRLTFHARAAALFTDHQQRRRLWGRTPGKSPVVSGHSLMMSIYMNSTQNYNYMFFYCCNGRGSCVLLAVNSILHLPTSVLAGIG